MQMGDERQGQVSCRQWRDRDQAFELRFHRGTAGDWRYGDLWERAKSVLGSRHSLD